MQAKRSGKGDYSDETAGRVIDAMPAAFRDLARAGGITHSSLTGLLILLGAWGVIEERATTYPSFEVTVIDLTPEARQRRATVLAQRAGQ